MTFLAILAVAALSAVVGMIVSVQRRGNGYYAHPTGQDKGNEITADVEAGTHTSARWK